MTHSRTFTLSNGDAIVVREPTIEADLDRLVSFLVSLPPAERNCLRYDVCDQEACRSRLSQLDGKHHFRLVAEIQGRLVGDVTLDRHPMSYATHVAEMRSVLAIGEHEHEVGTVLCRELLYLAERAGVEKLFAAVLPVHARLIAILEECNFEREATLRGFARDLLGTQHDLLLFTKDLQGAWDRLEMLIQDMDIRIPH